MFAFDGCGRDKQNHKQKKRSTRRRPISKPETEALIETIMKSSQQMRRLRQAAKARHALAQRRLQQEIDEFKRAEEATMQKSQEAAKKLIELTQDDDDTHDEAIQEAIKKTGLLNMKQKRAIQKLRRNTDHKKQVAAIKFHSILVKVEVKHKGKWHKTIAIADSGSGPSIFKICDVTGGVEPSQSRLVTADGSPMRGMAGAGTVKIRFPESNKDTEYSVTSEITTAPEFTRILGTQFMKENNAIIDFETQTLKVGEEEIPFAASRGTDRVNAIQQITTGQKTIEEILKQIDLATSELQDATEEHIPGIEKRLSELFAEGERAVEQRKEQRTQQRESYEEYDARVREDVVLEPNEQKKKPIRMQIMTTDQSLHASHTIVVEPVEVQLHTGDGIIQEKDDEGQNTTEKEQYGQENYEVKEVVQAVQTRPKMSATHDAVYAEVLLKNPTSVAQCIRKGSKIASVRRIDE